jgi:hypothetical protein
LLNFSGSITKIEWYAGRDATNAPFGKFEMRLCPTSLSQLTTTFQTNYGGHQPVLVKTADPLVLTVRTNQWFAVPLATPFSYNNRDNLIVEVRWENAQRETSLYTWTDDRPGQTWCLRQSRYNPTTGTLYELIPVVRITYSANAVAPTSLGRVKAIYY